MRGALLSGLHPLITGSSPVIRDCKVRADAYDAVLILYSS